MAAKPTITEAAADDMTFAELMELAWKHLAGYNSMTDFLEDYYDPARSALIRLLEDVGAITPGEELDADDHGPGCDGPLNCVCEVTP